MRYVIKSALEEADALFDSVEPDQYLVSVELEACGFVAHVSPDRADAFRFHDRCGALEVARGLGRDYRVVRLRFI